MSPAESIRNSNRLICDKSPNAMFVSLVYALLHIETGGLTWVNAGHNAPIYYNGVEDQLRSLMPTGMVLGIEPEAEYQQDTLTLHPGDFLLLYTDGVTDAIDSEFKEFGLKRLEQFVFEHRHNSAGEIIRLLENAVADHSGETTPFDDITIVLVNRNVEL
jgi:phosphoserine phosphatase RsbU/P